MLFRSTINMAVVPSSLRLAVTHELFDVLHDFFDASAFHATISTALLFYLTRYLTFGWREFNVVLVFGVSLN